MRKNGKSFFQDIDDIITYTAPQEMHPFLQERRGLYKGQCLFVAQPTSTQQVVRLVHFARMHHLAIVPQGGNTGLVGGQIPRCKQEIVLSLARMNRPPVINPDDNIVCVDAGCTLQALHQAAGVNKRLFPLRLPSQEVCQIGGNIATNAGGTAVVRYGMMRNLVLGLEVVLADGTLLDLNQPLIKNNNGYDLKHLFIGSEGTLGVITHATLRLFDEPNQKSEALFQVKSLAGALDLLHTLQAALGNSVTAFEIMCPDTSRLLPNFPFQTTHWSILLEAATALPVAVAQAHGALRISDAAQLWAWRDAIPTLQRQMGVSIKHDIGMPPSRMATFIQKASTAVREYMPQVRFIIFGHLGDGNLHFNVMEPENYPDDFLTHWQSISARVHACALGLGGTISAEHGIGQLKRDDMPHMHTPESLHAMTSIKKLLDPTNLFNPGKLL